MTGTSLILIKYTNSYELCWVPLGRLKEAHPVHHVVIVHCTKTRTKVSIWRFGYQVTWTLSKADSSFGPEGVRPHSYECVTTDLEFFPGIHDVGPESPNLIKSASRARNGTQGGVEGEG